MFCSIGAISKCNSFRMVGAIPSGPDALCGLRFRRSLFMPFVEISMSSLAVTVWALIR